MAAAFAQIIRFLAILMSGYAIGDLVDHFIPERGQPAPGIQQYNFMERIVRSVRFWVTVIIGVIIGFIVLKNQLKKRRR